MFGCSSLSVEVKYGDAFEGKRVFVALIQQELLDFDLQWLEFKLSWRFK